MGVVYFLKEQATDKGKLWQRHKDKQIMPQAYTETKLDSSTFEATKKQSAGKTKEAAEETKPKYKGSTKQRRQEETLERQRKVKAEGEQVTHKKKRLKKFHILKDERSKKRMQVQSAHGCLMMTVLRTA